MERLRFYRVEDSDQSGMYHSRNSPDCTWNMQDTKLRHPHWYSDTKLFEQMKLRGFSPNGPFEARFRFAFCSLQQLKFWIYEQEWRVDLQKHGFHVSVLDAEGFHGDTQGVYLASTRVDIETLGVLEV